MPYTRVRMKPRVTLENTSTKPALEAYSVERFCQAFDIGRSTAYKEIRAGRLKARKARARTLIAHEDAIARLKALPAR
jgi:hypothetical protein